MKKFYEEEWEGATDKTIVTFSIGEAMVGMRTKTISEDGRTTVNSYHRFFIPKSMFKRMIAAFNQEET